MRYVNTNVSKEAGQLHDWRGKIIERRYQTILVSDEPAAQIERLRYLARKTSDIDFGWRRRARIEE